MKSSKKHTLKDAFTRLVPCHETIAAKKGQFVLELLSGKNRPRVEKTEHNYLSGSLSFACGSISRNRLPIKIAEVVIKSGRYSVALAKGGLRGKVDVKTGKGVFSGAIVLSDPTSRWKKKLRAKFQCLIDSARCTLEFASAPIALRIPSAGGAVSARIYYIGRSSVIALGSTSNCTNEGTDGGSGGWYDVWCTGDCRKGNCVVWLDKHDGRGWQPTLYGSVFTKAKGVDYMCGCN